MKKPKGIIQRAVLPKSWNTLKRQNQESFAYTVKTEHVGSRIILDLDWHHRKVWEREGKKDSDMLSLKKPVSEATC